MTAHQAPPLFSIIVPVKNGAATLALCLASVVASSFDDYELIVVDDGSADASSTIAQQYTATVLQSGGIGPAGARNAAAQQASGAFLCFLDADCTLQVDTLAHSAARLAHDPTLDALVGSYTADTPIPTFAAQYKNLLHHFTHHQNAGRIVTFWTGYGVMRRTLFEQVGGFDAQRFSKPAIEDIELGYRATAAGATIVLDPTLQVAHHKRWSLRGVLSADIFARALPWSRLIVTTPSVPNTLNVSQSQRLSAVFALLLPLLLLIRWWRFALGAVVGLLLLNGRLYSLFWHQNGVAFALCSIVFHWIYFIYSAVVFAYAKGEYLLQNR